MGDKEQVMPVYLSPTQRRNEEGKLLAELATQLPRLRQLLGEVNGHWVYEDLIYRFYHQSFKVFGLQQTTLEIVKALQALAPHLELNNWFQLIVKEGTGREFKMNTTNDNWLEETRPIIEAFFHAHYFLEMACKYGGSVTEPPQSLPSGYAAFLYLFNLR
jgi:hypothetical protein